MMAVDQVLDAGNPFATKSVLPFKVPPFDRIEDEHYEPAIVAGMAEQQLEVKAIAENLEAATFANTIVALERTGALLTRVEAAFSAAAGANTNPTIEQVQEDMAPRLAAHEDAIFLNAALFRRVETVYGERAGLELDGESGRLIEYYYERFVHAGGRLNDPDKARLKELNEEESTLSNAFSRKLLAANKAGAFTTSDKAALAGMTEAQIASAARGDEGYVIPLQNTTQQPALSELSVRGTRQALFENAWNRAEKGDENDTRATIARLAKVRAEKAKLLGFSTYAAWKLDNQMAKTPAAAIAFMDALVPMAMVGAAMELKDIQDLIDAPGGGFKAQAWDWEFYAEQVRKAKYGIDEAQVRPYFEVDKVLTDGVLYAATELYGITFTERYDLPVFAPDVRAFEVFNADKSHLAILFFDFWKRDNKRGGAWMSSLVRQSRLLDEQPVVINVCNYTKPADGQPALISFSDVTTMFHEFGHALHGMFAEAEYPSLSGTNVPRDFVEFPSQFNERWATYPEVFAKYARHYQTGEAMPVELAAKLKRAESFNQGYARTELLAAAELDMEWHTLPADASISDPNAFEKAALAKKGLLVEAVPPRYRSSYFAHIWGGGYAAGYYAYLWAEMLDESAYQWFTDHGGMTRANGDRFREMVLSRGHTEDLAAMYERWAGEPASR